MVATYIYFERLFAIKAASKVDPNFMNQIKDHVSKGKIESANILCAQVNSPVSRLISKGISRIGRPLEDINSAIENAGKLEVYGLEKNVSVLATISGAAPMIGFLGTVIGMIIAIYNLLTPTKRLPVFNPSDVNPKLVDESVFHVRRNHKVKQTFSLCKFRIFVIYTFIMDDFSVMSKVLTLILKKQDCR